MTKHSWAPALWTTADGEIETARAPTEDELSELDHELFEWRGTHPDAMPPKLWVRLRQFIDWHLSQYPWNRERIRQMRWFHVREGLRRKMNRKRAYQFATTVLKGFPAQAEVG